MPIDPNIPLGVNAVPPTNPLALATQAAGLQGQINTNRAAQSTFAARNALGPIFQQGIDPSTGRPDINKIFDLMSKDPRAAYLAPEVTNQLIQRELTQKQITVQDLEGELKKVQLAKDKVFFAGEQIGMMNRTLGSLMVRGDTVKYDDLFDAASTLVGQMNDPLFTKNMALKLAQAPKQGGPALAKWIQEQNAAALTAKEQLDAQMGQLTTINSGLTTTLFRVTPYDQRMQRLGAVQNTMTPAEAATPQEGPIGPGGEKTQMLRGAMAEDSGQAPQSTYTGRGLVPSAAVAAATLMPGGGGAPTTVTPGSGASTPGPSAPALPRTMQTSLTPDQEAAASKMGSEVGEYIGDLNKRVRGSQDVLLRIAEMQDLITRIRTGGGSETRLSLAKLAQSLSAPNSVVDAISGGDSGAAETFKKYSVAGATEALRNLLIGSRMTNLEFEQFQKNNPNLDTDPRAIEKMLEFTTKIERLARQEQQEFVKFKGPTKDWPATWANIATEKGYVNESIGHNLKGTTKSTDREDRAQPEAEWEIKGGKLVRKEAK